MAIAKREYAPIGIIEDVLGKVANAINAKFDSFKSRVGQRYPGVPKKTLVKLRKDVDELRSNLSDIQVTD